MCVCACFDLPLKLSSHCDQITGWGYGSHRMPTRRWRQEAWYSSPVPSRHPLTSTGFTMATSFSKGTTPTTSGGCKRMLHTVASHRHCPLVKLPPKKMAISPARTPMISETKPAFLSTFYVSGSSCVNAGLDCHEHSVVCLNLHSC